MGKYLKMSGYFVGDLSINTDGQICDDKYFRGSTDISEDYYAPICHAINSHDELVDLLQAHCKAQYDGATLVRDLDVLLNGEDGAAIQASLCDIVAQVKKHGLSFNRVDELVSEVERLRYESEALMKCRMAAREFFNATVASGGSVEVSSASKSALDDADKASDWLEAELKATADLVNK